MTGVVHEYSTVAGVREDVVDILLNLKGVVFKLHNREEVTLVLRKQGAGVVLASDIELPHDVEIINPDHVIANLTDAGKLEMQIKVEQGRGYVPGNVRALSDDRTHTIGRIVLDASYSPVRRVSYSVESARVEQRTDLDKLVLDIKTNGEIGRASCREGVCQYVSISVVAGSLKKKNNKTQQQYILYQKSHINIHQTRVHMLHTNTPI